MTLKSVEWRKTGNCFSVSSIRRSTSNRRQRDGGLSFSGRGSRIEIMPPALGGDRTTRRQQATVSERKPDYFIGSSGLPTLTSPSVKMHHVGAGADGVRNSKLNKCLHNTAIRNGAAPAAGGPGTTGVGYTGAIDVRGRRSCKTESDITAIKPSTTGRYSKSPSPSTTVATLSFGPGCAQRFGNARRCTTADAGRTTGSAPGGWPSSSSSSSTNSSSWRSSSTGVSNSNSQLQKTCPPPRLLDGRTTGSNRPREGRPSQQCRYYHLHKQLDNRLTYQRRYDRNIFGYDQRMDHFVLPPLPS